MSKLTEIILVAKNTELRNTNRLTFTFFLFSTYVIHYTFRKLPRLGIFLKKISHSIPKKAFVVKNKIGTFEVTPFNDTITTSSEYFESEIQSWPSASDKKRIFLDLGANIGRYTIVAANIYKYSKILSVEANPSTFAILKRNIELNGHTEKVIACQTALDNKVGVVKFQVDQHHLGGGSIVSDYEDNPIPYIQTEVPSTTVDTLVQQKGLSPEEVDFVKIDVESFSYQVLQGMTDLMAKMQQGSHIMIEINNLNQETLALLGEYGFKVVEEKANDFLLVKTK